MPRCALGGQRVGSAPPTATNRHPRAAAGCCEIDRRLKRSPRYPAIWREYPSWRVNGAEGKGVDQAWNIGRWKRLPGLVAWAIGSYDPLQVVRPQVEQLGTIERLTVLAEVALCWLFALLSVAFVVFGYLGHADSPGPHSLNYVLAAGAVLAACLFYYSAAHLEKTSRFSPPHHVAPIAVLLLTFVVGRVAA